MHKRGYKDNTEFTIFRICNTFVTVLFLHLRIIGCVYNQKKLENLLLTEVNLLHIIWMFG